MICRREGCGHSIEVHGDRALPPACEGTHDDTGPLLVLPEADSPTQFAYVRNPPRSKNPACECKGFLSNAA